MTENNKIETPLFEELRQTSRESFESESVSNGSRDVCRNISKSGKSFELPLFEELRTTSRESFESETDSKDSRDVLLKVSKSGVFVLLTFRHHSHVRFRKKAAPYMYMIKYIQQQKQQHQQQL